MPKDTVLVKIISDKGAGLNQRPQLIGHIGEMLARLARLYQIPGFDATLSVDLAEWIVETYKYDRLEVIEKTLRNPPITGDRNFRLTPDTVALWIAKALEDESVKTERQASKMKEKHVSEAAEQYKAIDWKPSIVNVDKLISNFMESLKPTPKKPLEDIDDLTPRQHWKEKREKFNAQFDKK